MSVSGDSNDNEQSFADGAFQWNNDDHEDDQQNQAAYYEAKQTSTGKREVQTRRRDQSHILLVGDPGTGVSLDLITLLPTISTCSVTRR